VGALALVVACSGVDVRGAVVKVEKTKNPEVVTNAHGHTPYMYRADRVTTSACHGKCATFWPRWAARARVTGF
jgi:predicted lipoprotein with Yx(FWY)xxD motif